MSSFPTVSVLVLNLNGPQPLDACFASLEAQIYPRDRREVVLVDDSSTDDSTAWLRATYPGTRVVRMKSNQGICAAYNAAVRSCESDFVALLDSDTRVDSRWLSELVSAAGRHDAVSVAAKILDWTGDTVYSAGLVTSFIGHSWRVDSGGRPAADDRRQHEVVSGRA